MGTLDIRPENSAQGTKSAPNPFVESMLKRLTTEKQFEIGPRIAKLVDLGCGKLRHLDTCMNHAAEITLVDTKNQIERVQKFADMHCTMLQYVESIRDGRSSVSVVKIDDFEVQAINADVVLSVAVMDVVLRDARVQMASAAFRNLRARGYFVVVVPRNDSSILVNRKPDNSYEDGFVVRNRGHDNLTFFCNFRDTSPLLEILTKNGFQLIEDHSIYRQICWILQKPDHQPHSDQIRNT